MHPAGEIDARAGGPVARHLDESPRRFSRHRRPRSAACGQPPSRRRPGERIGEIGKGVGDEHLCQPRRVKVCPTAKTVTGVGQVEQWTNQLRPFAKKSPDAIAAVDRQRVASIFAPGLADRTQPVLNFASPQPKHRPMETDAVHARIRSQTAQRAHLAATQKTQDNVFGPVIGMVREQDAFGPSVGNGPREEFESSGAEAGLGRAASSASRCEIAPPLEDRFEAKSLGQFGHKLRITRRLGRTAFVIEVDHDQLQIGPKLSQPEQQSDAVRAARDPNTPGRPGNGCERTLEMKGWVTHSTSRSTARPELRDKIVESTNLSQTPTILPDKTMDVEYRPCSGRAEWSIMSCTS